MSEPIGPIAGITIGIAGLAGTVFLGFDSGVFMLAIIGSLMAQSKAGPTKRWYGYPAHVIFFSILALAITKIAIVVGHKYDWKMDDAAGAMAFLLAFFRLQILILSEQLFALVPIKLGKKEGE
jgi:hypothetical protein